MIDITKEQFDSANNNHKPNNWIKFAFRYFSNSTIEKDLSIKNNVVYFLLGIFLVAFLGTIFNIPISIISVATAVFSIVLTLLVLYLFSAVILNKIRINKIRKELGIDKDTYNALLRIFCD